MPVTAPDGMAYRDVGEGPAVVFLHGFPHDGHLWDATVDALQTRARCLVPDLRGFGASTAAGPYSMDQYADDVIAMLDHAGVPTAVMCGLSMGGYIAMALWRRHPSRVRGVVLCDTKATADTPESRDARNLMMTLAVAEGAEAIAAKQVLGMVGKTTRAQRPAVLEAMRAMMARQSVDGIVGALGALRDRPDSQDTLRSITVPVLVMVGEEDVLTPFSDAEAMIALLPLTTPARLEWIPHAGHVPCVETPEAFVLCLSEFLAHPALSFP